VTYHVGMSKTTDRLHAIEAAVELLEARLDQLSAHLGITKGDVEQHLLRIERLEQRLDIAMPAVLALQKAQGPIFLPASRWGDHDIVDALKQYGKDPTPNQPLKIPDDDGNDLTADDDPPDDTTPEPIKVDVGDNGTLYIPAQTIPKGTNTDDILETLRKAMTQPVPPETVWCRNGPAMGFRHAYDPLPNGDCATCTPIVKWDAVGYVAVTDTSDPDAPESTVHEVPVAKMTASPIRTNEQAKAAADRIIRHYRGHKAPSELPDYINDVTQQLYKQLVDAGLDLGAPGRIEMRVDQSEPMANRVTLIAEFIPAGYEGS
jgi:hypothetical protein